MDCIFDSFLFGDVFRDIVLVETTPVVFHDPSEVAADEFKLEFIVVDRIT